jgi:hypothetical protein
VDFSVDGSLMATASADQSAKLWDPATGEEIETLHHLKDVNSVAFSPDGVTIATASNDEVVKIWHLPEVLAHSAKMRDRIIGVATAAGLVSIVLLVALRLHCRRIESRKREQLENRAEEVALEQSRRLSDLLGKEVTISIEEVSQSLQSESARREREKKKGVYKKRKSLNERNGEKAKVEDEDARNAREHCEGVLAAASGAFGAAQRAEDKNRWEQFISSSGRVTLARIPFPSGPEGNCLWLSLDMDIEDRRKMVREALMRWHPDKFAQKFSARLDHAERDSILAKVNDIASEIAAVSQHADFIPGPAPPSSSTYEPHK